MKEAVTYAPYKQSERKEIYQICVRKLMQEGYAYPDFTTAEELDAIRAKQEAAKVDIGYYGEYAVGRNLTYEQIEEKLAAGEPYVVRLKSRARQARQLFTVTRSVVRSRCLRI